MEVRVPQPILCDAIHGGSGYNAAESAWCTETLIIRHNEQHVGSAIRRHDARRPPRSRFRGPLLDHTAEFRIRRRKSFPGNCRGGFGRAQDASDLLSRCPNATEDKKPRPPKHAAADFHRGKLRLVPWAFARSWCIQRMLP